VSGNLILKSKARAESFTSIYTSEGIKNLETTNELSDIAIDTSVILDISKDSLPSSNTIRPPYKEDFLAMADALEHCKIVNKLIKAGTSKAEADQLIAIRKLHLTK
jgi:hypothetical protein